MQAGVGGSKQARRLHGVTLGEWMGARIASFFHGGAQVVNKIARSLDRTITTLQAASQGGAHMSMDPR